jgi:glycogen synthase
MQKLALAVLVLSLGACQSFSWRGHGSGLSSEQQALGLKDVTALSNQYETESFFRSVRRRNDGRNNAFGRDLMNIQDFIDRHFWNYDKNDPTVNYPSSTSKLEHLGRFGLVTATSLPPVDEITTR